ncbi:hypothetical protein KAFR_0H01420 [Kazachstania africana CBS 2517]|uniref:SAGA-associated factor 11 n=1 Tax=Kazachstania africana (strain ATCC 22294 / BCRC 22015 / CBS 2517 / CECT 1963 / NBRC 1671 / NRRL Y-8276) TaxID=1071382 RepID=H2AYZ6_KAZAF|nr:hypothetical protein KAFR_0H01420 [Kazachstania africana CBS 2517]CCF59552.1 hypothetical protein KAFR_0H01420 [Kazachstania africana CBS 2517]
MSNSLETIDSISQKIYENLLSSMIQDITSMEFHKNRLLNARYPNLKPYYHDSSGKLDINGMAKQQESSQYFFCSNCNREVSSNRFAAHLQRCLNRGDGRR